MNKFIALLLLVSPVIWGCEKILKTETITYDQAFTYTFLQTASSTRAARLTRQDVLKRLNLPDDARIVKVEIQALSFRVSLNPTNQATSAVFNGFIRTSAGERELFKNQELTLSQAGILAGWVPLSGLIAAGIELLKAQINGWVNQFNNESFVDITITGVSRPSLAEMALDFSLQIKATVQYEHCVSTGKFLGSEGESCEAENILNQP